MTVQEAISVIKSIRKEYEKKKFGVEALDLSIQALEEVEQYRALGTVEELKEAREKQIAKKVIGIKAKLITRHCPSCQEWAVFELKRGMKFCPSCGQKLDWSEEDD